MIFSSRGVRLVWPGFDVRLLLCSLTVFLLVGCATPEEIRPQECPTLSVVDVEVTREKGSDDVTQVAGVVEQFARGLVGFDELEAQFCVETSDLLWRVVGRDGESFIVTLDYSPQRVNVVIISGMVSDVSVG
jgi:hypothetical protein